MVGGIGFVAIVGLGSLWFLRKKRNKVQQNIAFDRRALVSGTGMSQTRSPRGILPSQQSIYVSRHLNILFEKKQLKWNSLRLPTCVQLYTLKLLLRHLVLWGLWKMKPQVFIDLAMDLNPMPMFRVGIRECRKFDKCTIPAYDFLFAGRWFQVA